MFFDPVTAGVSLGVDLIQNIVGHNQKQEAAKLQNEQIAAAYRHKLKIQQSQIIRDDNIYNLKKQAYRDKLFNLDQTTQAAYEQEDLRLNELFKQAAFARQGENIQLAKGLGAAQASRSRGQSARRAEAMTMGAFGRNQAVRAEQLFTSKLASQMRKDTIQRNTAAARKAAYADVAYAPVRPIAPLEPTFVSGPSGMDLFGGLLGAAGSAFSAGAAQGTANQQLKSKNTIRDGSVASKGN